MAVSRRRGDPKGDRARMLERFGPALMKIYVRHGELLMPA